MDRVYSSYLNSHLIRRYFDKEEDKYTHYVEKILLLLKNWKWRCVFFLQLNDDKEEYNMIGGDIDI